MTEEKQETPRIPNWLGDREQIHMEIKREKRLTEYQVSIFRRELKKNRQLYNQLIERIPIREEAYKPICKTREELDQLYILGGMTEREYMRNRSAIWLCYSDRGRLERMEWLEEQLGIYERKLNRINQWLEDAAKERERRKQHRYQLKKKHVRAQTRYRKRKRKRELQERWRKYGIG